MSEGLNQFVAVAEESWNVWGDTFEVPVYPFGVDIKKRSSARGYCSRLPWGLVDFDCDIETRTSLNYHCKPCLCGSLKHSRTYHVNCPLNCRYADVR